jgi:hypothetical protein
MLDFLKGKSRQERRANDREAAKLNINPEQKAYLDMINANKERAQKIQEELFDILADLGWGICGFLDKTNDAIIARTVLKPLNFYEYQQFKKGQEEHARLKSAEESEKTAPESKDLGGGITEKAVMDAIEGANKDQADLVAKAEVKEKPAS